MRAIPVCMFHHVNRNAGDFITVSVANFAHQMAALKREGWTPLTLEEFSKIMLRKSAMPPRPVLLTFDDAWLDVYVHAFPILREPNFPFTVFAISSWCDAASAAPPQDLPTDFPRHGEAESAVMRGESPRLVCSWEQLREMQDSGLCSVGNHTARHKNATKQPPDEVRADIADCRARIREMLGRDTDHLCWPKGRHDAERLRLAAQLGCSFTHLTRRGVNLPGANPLRIHRFTVDDRPGDWLLRQLELFSRPVAGWLFARLKPDRFMKK